MFTETENKDEFYFTIEENKSVLRSCGVKSINCRGQKMYYISCSVCSQDSELYPHGSITTYKDNLKKGRIPCGCAKVPKYSKMQDYIIYKRNLVEYGTHRYIRGTYNKDHFCGTVVNIKGVDLTIIGWEYDVKGCRKIYKVFCKNCNSITDTTKGHINEQKLSCLCSSKITYTEKSLMLLLKDHITVRLGSEDFKLTLQWVGSVNESKVTIEYKGFVKNIKVRTALKNNFNIGNLLRKPVEVWEEKFNIASKGVQRLSNVTCNYFVYVCSICSSDEYVKNDLCTGIFKTKKDKFLKGQRSCRCGNKNLTPEQKLFKASSLLNNDEVNLYTKDGEDYIQWTCEQEHNNFSLLSNLLAGKRCKTCSSSSTGYYKRRCNEEDYLYILNVSDKYLKVGRSFTPYKRITSIINSVKNEDFKLVSLYKGTHSEVFRVEQEILLSAERKGERLKRFWTGELISNIYYQGALVIIMDGSLTDEGEYARSLCIPIKFIDC